MQEFLLSVANAKLELSDSERIKISMKRLVDENELSVLDTLDFPDIEAFSKWLYPTKHLTDKRAEVVDFQSFITFLEKTLSNSLLPGSDLKTTLSKTVEEEINHLRLKYKNTYEDVLIAILVHPYQCQSTGSTILFHVTI